MPSSEDPEPKPSVEPVTIAEPQAVPAPPPLQPWEPVAVPFTEDALVIEPVVDEPPIVLFADETTPMRRSVGRVLAADGYPVVPVEQLERIEADAAAGRLSLEGGQTCRAALSFEDVVARYFDAPRRATLTAQCMDRCTLQVILEDPDDEEFFEMYSTPNIRRPHDPRAWAKAKIRKADAGFGIGGLGLMGSSHPPPVRLQNFTSIGPWKPAPSGSRVLALQPRVARCAHPDSDFGFTYQLRISVADSGQVSRCTARTEDTGALPQGAACLCDEVETLRFGEGSAGRRFRLEAQDTGGFSPFDDLVQPLQPRTEPWVQRIREAKVLSRCMKTNPPDGDFDVTMVLGLAPDGAVEEARIFGDVTTMPKMKLSSCLVAEVRRVPLPCRPPGIDTLQLKILVKEV